MTAGAGPSFVVEDMPAPSPRKADTSNALSPAEVQSRFDRLVDPRPAEEIAASLRQRAGVDQQKGQQSWMQLVVVTAKADRVGRQRTAVKRRRRVRSIRGRPHDRLRAQKGGYRTHWANPMQSLCALSQKPTATNA